MNLNEIAGSMIAAVNPLVTATLQRSIGSTTAAEGSRVPLYSSPETVQCQLQSLQGGDLAMLDGLNIQGVRSKIYVNTQFSGAERSTQRGGDLITFADGSVYLVTTVLENWPGWCSVAVTLQD
jgi:hypothetical protein